MLNRSLLPLHVNIYTYEYLYTASSLNSIDCPAPERKVTSNMGGTVSCYSSSTCNGTAVSSSLQPDYSSCFPFCSSNSGRYFTFDGTITSGGDNCFCFASDQCASAVYLPNQPRSILYTLNDAVSHSCMPSVSMSGHSALSHLVSDCI